jgi:NAD(P)-dependent dehydrogenase (short-subunit alcohol dehydrogenase family)
MVMDDSLDLTGHVAIVTGAGRGLGRHFALQVAQAGGAVALVGRYRDALDGVSAEICALGGHAASFVSDVRDADAACEAVAATEAQLGPVTILVNNAGMLSLGAVATLDVNQFWESMAVNVQGPLIWTRAVLQSMFARRAGRIINVTSTVGNSPMANAAAYCCSKSALTMLTAVLGLELVGTGVVTFALAPLAATDMTRQGLTAPELNDEQRALYAAMLADPDPLLADSLRLLRTMLSGRLDHVSGSCLVSNRPLDAQVPELGTH